MPEKLTPRLANARIIPASPSTRRPFMRGHTRRAGSGARGFGLHLNSNSRADFANVVWRRVARHGVRGPGSERRSGLARSPRDFPRGPLDRKAAARRPSRRTLRSVRSQSPLARARAQAIRPQRSEGKQSPENPRGGRREAILCLNFCARTAPSASSRGHRRSTSPVRWTEAPQTRVRPRERKTMSRLPPKVSGRPSRKWRRIAGRGEES